MTDEELNKAIEVAEESVAGFADDGSFEHLLAMAVLELKDRVLKEREACAKVAENRMLHDKNENIKKGYFYAQQSIAQDIRLRGQE
jgi:hypothetical protein